MSLEAGLNAPQVPPSPSSTCLPHTAYGPQAQPAYHPHDILPLDNQPNEKRPPFLEPNTLHEPSAPPYPNRPPSVNQDEPSAPIDDPIQQQILDAEQDPNSAPIDDDTISLAAPIYEPTAVATAYVTYVQEPTIDHIDTSRKHKHRIAMIAFIVQLVGFLGVAIFVTVLWIIRYQHYGQSEWMPYVMVALAPAAPMLLYAIFMMVFVNRYPAFAINSAFALTMFVGGAVAVIIWHILDTNLAVPWIPVIGFAMVLLSVCWFHLRRKIPFTSSLLKSASTLSRKHRSVRILAYAGLTVQLLLTFFFLLIAGAEHLFQKELGSNQPIIVVLCFPCYYWTSQVITNIVYATVAGVAATHYLPSKASSETSLKSCLRRVCTTSLGSICYASLILAPVQIVRKVSNALRTSEDDVDVCCVSFLDAIIGCVRGFNTSINKYAFYDVAAYGKPFYLAAKDTWSSIESRGIDVLLRDFVLDYVLIAHAVIYGFFCGGLANNIADFSSLYVLAIAWSAMQIVFSVGAVADASAASALVALAKDPLVFAKANPELFAELREAYPAASFGLMVIIPGFP